MKLIKPYPENQNGLTDKWNSHELKALFLQDVPEYGAIPFSVSPPEPP
jgi:hypothetical protein